MSDDMKSPAHITSFFVCDDVRIESNHKQFYIGVYSESVIFNDTPANAVLRPVILTQSEQVGSFPIWCRFSWPGLELVAEDGEPVRYVNEINFESANCSIAIPLPPLPLIVTGKGEIVMDTSRDGENWSRTSAVQIDTIVETSN